MFLILFLLARFMQYETTKAASEAALGPEFLRGPERAAER